ncbi:MAG: hypothetical protein AAF939_01775 [Planctomycetota bacterium]
MSKTMVFSAFLKCFTVLFLLSNVSSATEKYDLRADFSTQTQQRISTNFEHKGDVVVIAEDEENPIKFLPYAFSAKSNYYQRMTGTTQAIRYFDKASGKIRLGGGKTAPSLGESNRYVIARLKKEQGYRVEMASITDMLSPAELEIVDQPADPLTISKLLFKKSVQEGQSWKPDNLALAKFLGVREVKKSSVKLTAKKMNANSARVYISGTVDADVYDVESFMKISGLFVVDRKQNVLTTMKLTIEENRKPGQIEPGFEGKVSMDMRITSEASSAKLSDESLAKISSQNKIKQRIKLESQAIGYRLQFDPRWKVIASDEEAALLRLMDRGQLLAQCNFVILPQRSRNQLISLEDYKQQVQRIAESDDNAEMKTANSRVSPTGNRVSQVVVRGIEQGLPIQWIYYHIGNSDGRQLTLVFTMDAEVADRVAGFANRIVDEFDFIQPKKKIAAKPNTNSRQTR